MNNTLTGNTSDRLRVPLRALCIAAMAVVTLLACQAKTTGEKEPVATTNNKVPVQHISSRPGSANISNPEIKAIADYLESYGMHLRKKDTATKL